jgi:DNA-binding IclR family transcriptional regulator
MAPSMSDAGRNAVRGESMIGRVARVLRAFDDEHGSLTVSEVAERAQLPVATAHRIIAEMVTERMLDREAHRYVIGTGLWEQGELAPVSRNFRENALPHLLGLYEVSGENVHLAILDGHEALYVARLIGHRSVPTVSRMGGRLPLHTTGVGKVLLAYQSEEFLEDFFTEPLERSTPHSRVSEPQLRAEFESIRARGFCVTNQEMTLGNASVAVPIFVSDGAPFAAVGLVTHLISLDPRRSVPLLKDAAAAIADGLRATLEGNGIVRSNVRR